VAGHWLLLGGNLYVSQVVISCGCGYLVAACGAKTGVKLLCSIFPFVDTFGC
jgi:hypothetical protein